MGVPEQSQTVAPGAWARALHIGIYAWIAATALFFYARFTLAFLRANEDAIRSLFR